MLKELNAVIRMVAEQSLDEVQLGAFVVKVMKLRLS
jgi:hypothetical protein